MQKNRTALSSLLIGMAGGCLAPPVAALEFGPAPQSVALGQALDFSVPLRLDPGESIPPECVTADLTLGDKQVPRPLVRARLERTGPASAVARATSSLIVDEPMIFIELAVGCPARLTRRFVVLADPSIAAVLPVQPISGPATETAPNTTAPPATRPAAGSTARAIEAAEPASRPEGPRARPPRGAVAPPPRYAESVGKAVHPRASDAAASAPGTARLKMDTVEPAPRRATPLATLVEEAKQAIEAGAQSADAARTGASEPATAAARIAVLEKSMADLHKESRAQHELMLQMQAQLMAAESGNRWVLPLVMMLAALAGLAGWLAWRMRQMQRLVRSTGQPASPLPLLDTAQADGAATSLPPNYDSTSLPNLEMHAGSPRDVSIEELMDLEQQAEFFIALGHEESAVELLTDHLRSSEDGNPMAYLKLLEIYKRRGDRAAYEQIRQGFNQSFNAYAPVWEAELHAGLALENYPDVIQQLQKAWPRPLIALAELAKLIFHTQHGDVFDLPAFHDVLFLYALARDLADHGPSVVLARGDLVPQPHEVVEFRGTEQHLDITDDEITTVGAGDSNMSTTLVDLDLRLDLDLDTTPGTDPVPVIDEAFDLNLDLNLNDLPMPDRWARRF